MQEKVCILPTIYKLCEVFIFLHLKKQCTVFIHVFTYINIVIKKSCVQPLHTIIVELERDDITDLHLLPECQAARTGP